jgi:hypothetical protein
VLKSTKNRAYSLSTKLIIIANYLREIVGYRVSLIKRSIT